MTCKQFNEHRSIETMWRVVFSLDLLGFTLGMNILGVTSVETFGCLLDICLFIISLYLRKSLDKSEMH